MSDSAMAVDQARTLQVDIMDPTVETSTPHLKPILEFPTNTNLLTSPIPGYRPNAGPQLALAVKEECAKVKRMLPLHMHRAHGTVVSSNVALNAEPIKLGGTTYQVVTMPEAYLTEFPSIPGQSVAVRRGMAKLVFLMNHDDDSKS